MAIPFMGFRKVNSACGLSEKLEESDENRIRFWKWRTASGQLELGIRKLFIRFIPKLMDYGQSFFRFSASACILRETQISQFFRY
jgi:hypothetical protein